MKITAIIQARLGSTRLPRKILMDLEGKTVLGHVIARVRRSIYISEMLVATTAKGEDNAVADLCSKMNIAVFRGSEDDVLDRFYQAALIYKPDHIVRITADCPFMDAAVIDDIIKLHLTEKADYTSNVLKETYPDGEDVEVFTMASLKKTWQSAKLKSEREHVTPYIRNNSQIFKLRNLEYAGNLSQKRWTLDEHRDYIFIKTVYANLYKNNPAFGMKDILEFLRKHPAIENLNEGIGRNEGYLKSLKSDKMP